MKLTTLYKQAKTGKTQVLSIETIGDKYVVTWGQLNGKQQQKPTTCSPKNVGKTNETTAEEQAILEAKAVHAKKIKAGYSTDETAPITVKLPMKVSKFQDHTSKVNYPCFVSPKLDGVNCMYVYDDVAKSFKLYSRGGEEYPVPPHQLDDISTMMTHLGVKTLNGEMYIHGEYLQDIQSAVKKHNDLTPKLQFWIFEFPDSKLETYNVRAKYYYDRAAELGELNTVKLTNTWVAKTEDDIAHIYEFVMDAGYEGLIIRNQSCKYVHNHRSLDVFKLKKANDAEFEIMDYSEDKNGHPVFTAYVDRKSSNKTFKFKFKGTHEERCAMLVNADRTIGKFATVEFETFSKDGKPLKPVGIRLREVDKDGNPIE